VVFHIGPDFRMVFGDAAKFTFPIAVEDDPIDLATARVGFPAVGFGGVKIDVARGAGGPVKNSRPLDASRSAFHALHSSRVRRYPTTLSGIAGQKN
jgi:hypothetical protein